MRISNGAMVRFLAKLQGVEPELPIPVDSNVIEDEDGNVIYPPSENAVRLPDEFMPDWYQERTDRINARNSESGGSEVSNE